MTILLIFFSSFILYYLSRPKEFADESDFVFEEWEVEQYLKDGDSSFYKPKPSDNKLTEEPTPDVNENDDEFQRDTSNS